jgi:hypothetical protein
MWKFRILSTAAAVLLCGCSARFVDTGCSKVRPVDLPFGNTASFQVDLKQKCNPSGIMLEANRHYRFNVTPLNPLADAMIKCLPPDYSCSAPNSVPLTPDGYKADQLPWYLRFILWLGESSRPYDGEGANWLQLVGTVGYSNVEFFPITWYTSESKQFIAKENGELFALANDYPWFWRYCNNEGVVKVSVTKVKDK